MEYVLHYAPDNASLVVRLVLEELGLPYRAVLIDRSRAEQRGAAFRALNPGGRIPVLVTPQGPLFETAAILLWLADRHGRLAPGPDDAQRGAFLKWLFFASNTLHADLRMLFYPDQYAGPDPDAQAALCRSLVPRLREHLGHLDAVAAGAPDWLSDVAPSVLGYYVACMMRWMAIYPTGRDRSWYLPLDTPHLARMLGMLEDRPATRATGAAEGLGPCPFTAPRRPNPPEGSPT